LLAAAVGAQTIDRTKPPQTPAIPSYKLPPIFETKLPNGMAVSLVEDARFPLVTARLSFMAGSKFDPKDSPGLAEAVASLLTEGTKTRTSREISEATDDIGASMGAGAGPDALTVSGNTLSDNLDRFLELMADAVRNAAFPQDEVDLYKKNRLQSLLSDRSDPSYLATEKFTETLYGSTPYAHIGPTEVSIEKLDRKSLAAFRDAHLTPNNATLILIGKLPERAALMKTVADRFGSWERKDAQPAPKIEPPAPKRQIVLVDRPGSVQADIHVGRVAPTRSSAEYFPLMVGNAILGGGANSRMFKNIREKEGFAYDAHSEYDVKRDSGEVAAVTEVRNEVIEPALRALLGELQQIAGTRVSAQELSGTKNYIAGTYLLSLGSQDGLASRLDRLKTLGLPNESLETFTANVRNVEPDQILAAAKKYLSPDQDAIVVVGDASKIGDALKKFGNVTVTKAD
jgi:zinc protease